MVGLKESMMVDIEDKKKCEWIFYYKDKDKNKTYVICKNCGRVKRKDLPDVRECAGTNASRRNMIRKMLGQDDPKFIIEE